MTTPEPTSPSNLFAPFLPTTSNIPEEEDRLRSFLVDRFANYADIINDKKIGVYSVATENFNGEVWWYITPKVIRNGYQTFAYIPSYPNTGVLTLTLTGNPSFPIPNINNEFVITQLYGTASKPSVTDDTSVAGTGDYFSFMNQGDPRISFTMSNKQIVITTTVDLSAYSGFIVVSYLRNGV
jgi:hypothetical protein